MNQLNFVHNNYINLKLFIYPKKLKALHNYALINNPPNFWFIKKKTANPLAISLPKS